MHVDIIVNHRWITEFTGNEIDGEKGFSGVHRVAFAIWDSIWGFIIMHSKCMSK